MSENKTIRLGGANDNYIRPEKTYQQNLNEKQIKEKLMEYKRIDLSENSKNIPLNSHIRYFNITDNNQNSDQDSSVLIMVEDAVDNDLQVHLKVFSPRSTTLYKYIWAACNSDSGYNKVGTMVKTTTAAGGLKLETAGTFSEIHASVYGVKHE